MEELKRLNCFYWTQPSANQKEASPVCYCLLSHRQWRHHGPPGILYLFVSCIQNIYIYIYIECLEQIVPSKEMFLDICVIVVANIYLYAQHGAFVSLELSRPISFFEAVRTDDAGWGREVVPSGSAGRRKLRLLSTDCGPTSAGSIFSLESRAELVTFSWYSADIQLMYGHTHTHTHTHLLCGDGEVPTKQVCVLCMSRCCFWSSADYLSDCFLSQGFRSLVCVSTSPKKLNLIDALRGFLLKSHQHALRGEGRSPHTEPQSYTNVKKKSNTMM